MGQTWLAVFYGEQMLNDPELKRERRNQVEPRCAERWHLRDDEQFDLAAWFLLPKGKECGVAILHSNT